MFERMHQIAVGSAGEIPSPNRTGKQCVPGKKILIHKQADPTRRVAWRMDYLEDQITALNFVLIVEMQIGPRRC